jgi:hypothetical protein
LNAKEKEKERRETQSKGEKSNVHYVKPRGDTTLVIMING